MTSELSTPPSEPLTDRMINDILTMHPDHFGNVFSAHAPTPTLEAIYRTGAFIRTNPGEPIRQSEVPVHSIDPRNFARTVLAELINATLEPPVVQPDLHAFSGAGTKVKDACNHAEGLFYDSLKHMEKPYPGVPQPDVFFDGDVPVLLRKRIGEKTCLALQAITIDDVTYPAGSIVYPYVPEEIKHAVRKEHRDMRYAPFDISHIETLGFLRLSLFAIPPKQRPNWKYTIATKRSQRRTIGRMTVPNITAHIQNITER